MMRDRLPRPLTPEEWSVIEGGFSLRASRIGASARRVPGRLAADGFLGAVPREGERGGDEFRDIGAAQRVRHYERITASDAERSIPTSCTDRVVRAHVAAADAGNCR
jgi:hypothetical protein